MSNINFNFNFGPARPQHPYGCAPAWGGGCNSGAGEALAPLDGLAVGMLIGGAMSGCGSPEAQNAFGRGFMLADFLRKAFDDGCCCEESPQAEQPKESNYGEVEITQKEPKKGDKSVPPDVKFKGDLNKLPEILQAAGVGTQQESK